MNKLLENIQTGFVSLFSNKMRAMLTTLGIGIGIAAVTILVSLGQSVQSYVNDQIMGVGANLIVVMPGTREQSMSMGGPFRTSSSTLTEKDVALISDPFNVPNVDEIAPLLMLSSRPVDYGSKEVRTPTYGTTPSYVKVINISMEAGRIFDEQDMLSNARVVVLGPTTVKNLFGENVNPVGETVRIADVPFKVIGTTQKYGGSSFGEDPDDFIVMPLTTAHVKIQTQRSLSGQLPVDVIYLKASSQEAIDGVVNRMTTLLREEHKIKPNKDDDFTVTTQKDMISSFNAIIGVLTVFLSIIGGVSLLVGGIGVMNIMLVTVTERTREIGLRKAVGARYLDVLLQFLTEAVMLCFVGGGAGLAVAVVFTAILRAIVPDLHPAVYAQGVILAVSVTSMIGLFFGIYPASRAAALSPISALRFE